MFLFFDSWSLCEAADDDDLSHTLAKEPWLKPRLGTLLRVKQSKRYV